MLKSINKYLLVLLGTLSLAIGVIGVFLPVLPTTPFLLVAAYCYMRSSNRLYAWLLRHKVFGVYIYNYITYKAISRNAKIFSLMFLWGTLIASMILMNNWYVRAFLLLVGIGVSIHLVTMKPLIKAELNKPDVKEDA